MQGQLEGRNTTHCVSYETREGFRFRELETRFEEPTRGKGSQIWEHHGYFLVLLVLEVLIILKVFVFLCEQ